MKNKKLPLSNQLAMEDIYSLVGRIPSGLNVFMFLKSVREGLHMTQAQLANRIGIPQSHIAKIEAGKVDAQLQTLRKMFEALNCDLVVFPLPRNKSEVILAERALIVAEKKVARLRGTMALESQTPDDRMIRQMVNSEQEKLLQNPSSELWEE